MKLSPVQTVRAGAERITHALLWRRSPSARLARAHEHWLVQLTWLGSRTPMATATPRSFLAASHSWRSSSRRSASIRGPRPAGAPPGNGSGCSEPPQPRDAPGRQLRPSRSVNRDTTPLKGDLASAQRRGQVVVSLLATPAIAASCGNATSASTSACGPRERSTGTAKRVNDWASAAARHQRYLVLFSNRIDQKANAWSVALDQKANV